MNSINSLSALAELIRPKKPFATPRGRFAPSPTGYIHLGNAWSFLTCWLAARKDHGSMILRIEDIDPDRSKELFVEGVIKDLQWLGLDWDEGADVGGDYAPYTQSESLELYEKAIDILRKEGLAYPCYCTRKELRSLASAPHMCDYGAAYPEICLNLSGEEREEREESGRRPAIRLHSSKDSICFKDALHGEVCMKWKDCGGDFPLKRSDGVYAYQLAVVLDDIRQGVNQIVRGEDILHCTPRQVYLYELLEYEPPEYIHVPLVFDAEGERLAKRHAHFELRKMREMGITPEAVIGYLAFKGGIISEKRAIPPADLLKDFSISKLSVEPIVLEENILEQLAALSAG